MHVSKVEICGVNTAKLPVLTNEEMQKLFIKIKAGDFAGKSEQAMNKIKLDEK